MFCFFGEKIRYASLDGSGKKRARLALQGLWGCWWREAGPRPRLWPVGGGCGLGPTVMLDPFLVEV